MKKNEIVLFKNGNLEINVEITPEKETVWLTQKQMSYLFNVTTDNIGLHIKNIFKSKELDNSVSEDSSVTASDGKTYKVKKYNLDMIISVGYRVNSKNGIIFRKWANKVLKEYLIKGYAVNEKRLIALNKTIDIQNKMLSSSLDIETAELSKVINEYTKALDILDDYDHQVLKKIKGKKCIYELTYKDALSIIKSMKFNNNSKLFGLEKEEGKLEGILKQIYQHVFGEEVYKTLESKAAHLLYFLIKDHPFADGCKRIGATLFLEFLNRNNYLYRNGQLILSNDALVAITLLVAESNPDEIDSIINVIENLLC